MKKTEVAGARPTKTHAGSRGSRKEAQQQISKQNKNKALNENACGGVKSIHQTLPKERPEAKLDKNGFVRCRVCGCTEMDACPEGCSWADDDLCSVCHETVSAMAEWHERCRLPVMAALLREYRRVVWDTPLPYRLTKKGLKAAGGAR